jgi:hypothetical protein
MTENSSRKDILEVVIGILLMLPLMFLVAWAALGAIDYFMLRDANDPLEFSSRNR